MTAARQRLSALEEGCQDHLSGAQNSRSWADVKRVQFRKRKNRRLESGWNKDTRRFKLSKHLHPILLAHTRRLLLARGVPPTLPSKSGLEVNVREIHPPHPTPRKTPTLFPADFFLVRQKESSKEAEKRFTEDSCQLA